MPWGEGDTPIKPVLQLLKEKKYPLPALVEYEYRGRAGTPVEEVQKCLDYMRQSLAPVAVALCRRDIPALVSVSRNRLRTGEIVWQDKPQREEFIVVYRHLRDQALCFFLGQAPLSA